MAPCSDGLPSPVREGPPGRGYAGRRSDAQSDQVVRLSRATRGRPLWPRTRCRRPAARRPSEQCELRRQHHAPSRNTPGWAASLNTWRSEALCCRSGASERSLQADFLSRRLFPQKGRPSSSWPTCPPLLLQAFLRGLRRLRPAPADPSTPLWICTRSGAGLLLGVHPSPFIRRWYACTGLRRPHRMPAANPECDRLGLRAFSPSAAAPHGDVLPAGATQAVFPPGGW